MGRGRSQRKGKNNKQQSQSEEQQENNNNNNNNNEQKNEIPDIKSIIATMSETEKQLFEQRKTDLYEQIKSKKVKRLQVTTKDIARAVKEMFPSAATKVKK